MAVVFAALILPTALENSLIVHDDPAQDRLLTLFYGTAILLLLLYCLYLCYEVCSPAEFFHVDLSNEEEAEDYSVGSALNLWAILGLLFVVAISVTSCATYLVPTIGPVASALHTSKTFVRFIFIPLATNAGSLATAIITGYCGGLDLAIYNVF